MAKKQLSRNFSLDKESNKGIESFRNLGNYKAQYKSQAESKGRLKEFLAAETLTAARKILHHGG